MLHIDAVFKHQQPAIMDSPKAIEQAIEPAAPQQPSPLCQNCGAVLHGDFCHACGQQVKEVKRPFLVLIQEMLFVVFELDGRAYRTVFLLLTRPGYLSKAFVEGRRASYTPPLRLFLFITIAFLLFISGADALLNIREVMNTPMQATAELAVDGTVEGRVEEASETGAATPDIELESDIQIDEEDMNDLHDFIDQISFSWLSDQNMTSLRNLMHQQVDSNVEEFTADPRGFLVESLDYLTFFILLMMPILAFYKKVMLIFSGKYYIEHLILTLHNHSFLILALFVMTIFDMLAGLSLPYLSQSSDIISTLTVLWIPIYLFLSLKFFIGWGYFLTLIIFSFTSLLYLITMAISLIFFGAALFLLV